MRALVEITIEKDELDEDNRPLIEKRRAFLLHWGLKSETFMIDDSHVSGVSYTVAVCQDFETGKVGCYAPEQIRILGDEIK